jgi:hypothetical protein
MARHHRVWFAVALALGTAVIGCGGVSNDLFSGGSGASTSAGGSASVAGHTGAKGGSSSAGASASGGNANAGAPSGGGATGGRASGGAATGGGAAGGSANAGAGGAPGSAGVGGAGQAGMPGSAGVTGSAGTAAGGNAGAGAGGYSGAGVGGYSGVGGSGGDATCAELMALAASELNTARACDNGRNALQCTGQVANVCGCQTSVETNDSAATQAYLATLERIQDKHCAIACSALACLPSQRGVCESLVGTTVSGLCASVAGPITR